MKKLNNAQGFEDFVKSKLYELVKKVATRSGFFEYYFKVLPKCKNHKKAFFMVNDLYYLILGQHKYNSYNSFHKQLTIHLKKKSHEL